MSNTNVVRFPANPGKVPATVRIENTAALIRIPELMAKCERLRLPRHARRLRAINATLGGAALPVLRKVGAR